MFRNAIVLGLVGCMLTVGVANANDWRAVKPMEFEMIEIRSLSAMQIQKLLVGHTYPLSKGEIYFPSATDATLAWNGTIEHTSWYATDNSRFCFIMSGKEVCLGLRKGEGGHYVQDHQGKKTVIPSEQIVKGKVFHSYFR